jgi:mono/diheme cytochrome c family protein
MVPSTKVMCPHCLAPLRSDQAPRPGKKATCPRCGARFSLPEPVASAAVPVAVGVNPPPKSVPAAPPPATPGHRRAWLVPAVAAACIGAFSVVGVAVVAFFMTSAPPAEDPPTQAPPSVAGAKAAAPAANTPSPAAQVRSIFELNCFRCHGQDDYAEAGVYILDRDKLVALKKIVPGNPDNSRLMQRLLSDKRPMPPEDETPRPSADDIALVKQWIAAGAPSVAAPAPAAPVTAGPLLDAGYLLKAVHDHLLTVAEQDRKYERYFTLTHLAGNPTEVKSLPLYRAGLAKLLNSLSWKKTIVQPKPIDPAETIYAVDLRDLDWDTPDRWQDIVRAYPYGIHYDTGVNAALRALGSEVERLAGTALPTVRADWFIATASRPPLYHTLLALPTSARQLEQQLGVELSADFLNGKLRRSGFLKSNVSSQNRLLERHDSRFGAYWRSYDFRSSQNRDSLITFPLGPGPTFIANHPFPNLAFEQAGGELIFNLPNGLQGYMLVDGKDNRIDIAPIEVVRDRDETSGTPQIVNGLSCMACHTNGMITGDNVKDVIREGSAVDGAARTLVDELYVAPADMDKVLQSDADRFQRAMKRTLAQFPLSGGDEPVSAVAKPFNKRGVDLKTAAFELGLADPQILQQAIRTNQTLRQLGLEPLAQGNAIQRASWEQLQNGQSLFQRVAQELRLGSPVGH